jgi:SAM-dependent methyltransferase
MNLEQHNAEIQENLAYWNNKPTLRKVYRGFHEAIGAQLSGIQGHHIAELGSGIGNIKEVIPACIRTDLFPNPWIDQLESAYRLSFDNESASDLILFDVFHHLRYPGRALEEFQRVLVPGGRVIIFDPCVSLLGRLIFGLCHHEPIGLREPITWLPPSGWDVDKDDYYAAQGNAFRVFVKDEFESDLRTWKRVLCRRLSAISYVATGGYSKPQLYPQSMLPVMRSIDRVCDFLPAVFATRLLVVLEKKD